MPPFEDNSTRPSRWELIKQRFLQLSLRAQIIVVIIGIVIITGAVVAASTIIANPSGGTPGVGLKFNPTSDAIGSILTGDVLTLDVVLDTDGQDVAAVAAVINFDSTKFTIDCIDTTNCKGVTVNSTVFDSIPEIRRSGDQLRIVAGNVAGISGNDIQVATVTFVVLPNANFGPTTLAFNQIDSAIVANDGFGTDIAGFYANEEFNILLLNFIIIDGPTATVAPGGTSVQIDWTTSLASDGAVAVSTTSCPGCSWSDFIAAGANVTNGSGTDILAHSVTVNGLTADTGYFYRVRSTRGISQVVSEEMSFYTGNVAPPPRTLIISNLSADTYARSAVITWNTNFISNSDITMTSGGIGSISDSIETLSHSLRYTGLAPNTHYCVDATSKVVSTIPNGPPTCASDAAGCATKNICFHTEIEDVSLDSNIVFNVARDRVCGQWLSCASSVTIENTQGEEQALCFDLAGCSELDPTTGECKKFLNPNEQVTSFKIVRGTPAQSTVDAAHNLSGYIRPGAVWTSTSTDPTFVQGTVGGFSSYAGMDQVGSSLSIPNSNFETKLVFPWEARHANKANTIANIAEVQVVEDRSDIQRGATQVLQVRPNKVSFSTVSGVKVPLGQSIRTDVQYYVSMDIRSDEPTNQDMIVQFGFKNYSTFPSYATGLVTVSSGWQQVIAGPLEVHATDIPGTGEQTYLGILYSTDGTSPPYQPFFIDNVSIHPVLNVGIGTNITKSCRSYATDDAPACRYFDINSGREYQGWEGYCVETDPRNPRRCIQWLPIDIIAGSQSINSVSERVGYGSDTGVDRFPLYYCIEATGAVPYVNHEISSQTIVVKNVESTRTWEFGNLPGATGRPLDILDDGIDIYRNEITEVKVTQIQLDSNGDTDFDCSIQVPSGSPSTASGHTGTLVFNQQNYYDWDSANSLQIKCEDGTKTQVNPGAYLYCKHGDQDNECNTMTGHLVFDENDRLDGIWLQYNDGSANKGAAQLGPIFITYRGGRCEAIAQVVDPFGENFAFSKRVQSETYQVEGLGYQRGQDYAPYGSIVPPKPDYDPEKWDSNGDLPGRQPLYVEPPDTQSFPEAPYQARAGAPYGVSDIPVNLTATPRTCIAPASKAGISCTDSSDCDSVTGGTCDLSSPVCVGGTSEGTACNPAVSPTCAGGGYCVTSAGVCTTGPNIGAICGAGGNQCNSGDGQCSQQVITSIVQQIGTGICISGSSVGAPCSTHSQCGAGLSGLGVCAGVIPPNAISTADYLDIINKTTNGGAVLSQLFARSMGIWVWDVYQNKYREVCRNAGECTDYKCNGGLEDGHACDPSPPSGTIDLCTAGGGTCNVDQVYGWDIATNSTILDQSNPPRTENLRIKGGVGDSRNNPTVDIYLKNGQGGASLSFNSIVDPNQIPLTRYTVDWDDNRITEESNLKIAPKSSQSNPHLLAHTYFCEGPGSPGWANYGVSGACAFKPKVQIEDNWGWCSGTGLPNHVSAGACESWDQFQGRIIVCPAGGASGSCNQPPVAIASATPTTGRIGTTVSFNGSGSIDPDGSISGYSWDFGDGSTGSGATVTHQYNTPGGPWIARLTVTDNNGATAVSGSIAITIQANANPVANAGADQTVTDNDNNGSETVSLNGSASTDDVGITNYTWSEGGTTIGTGSIISQTLNVGTHTITLTVQDGEGGTSSDTIIIRVLPQQPAPIVTLMRILPASGTGQAPLDVSLDYNVDQDSTCAYILDGVTNIGSQPVTAGAYTVVFPGLNAGTHRFMVECTNTIGTGYDEEPAYEVLPAPSAPPTITSFESFKQSTPETIFFPNDRIDFQLVASDSDNATLSMDVDFQGGMTGTITGQVINQGSTVSFVNIYGNPGTYNVTATVSDGTSTDSRTITINILRWWNIGYRYRQQLNVTNTQAGTLTSSFPVNFVLSTSPLATAGKLLSSGPAYNDLRLVYDNAGTYVELDRHIIESTPGQASIWFSTQADIPAGGSDGNYYLYYGNATAGTAPTNLNNVYYKDNYVCAAGSDCLPTDAVAVYHFEDRAGTTLVDSKNNINGRLTNGPVWTTGRFGGGLDFDGTNDFVKIAHDARLQLAQGTIEMWAITNGTSANNQTYFSKDQSGGGTGGHVFAMIDQGDIVLPGRILYRLQDPGGQNVSVRINSNKDEGFDVWHHLAITWGPAGPRMYINGVQQASTDPTWTTGINTNNVPLYLGTNTWGDPGNETALQDYLDGRLDEFRISSTQKSSFPAATVTSDPTAAKLGLEEDRDNPRILIPYTGEKQVAGASTVAGTTDSVVSIPPREHNKPYEIWKPFVSAVKFISKIVLE